MDHKDDCQMLQDRPIVVLLPLAQDFTVEKVGAGTFRIRCHGCGVEGVLRVRSGIFPDPRIEHQADCPVIARLIQVGWASILAEILAELRC
jgi:hypothetical protein